MKKLVIFTVLLLGYLSLNAQQRIDSTTVKIKIEKFQHQVRNSKIATIVSLSTVGVGGAMVVTNLIVNPGDFDHGLAMAGLGVAGAGVVASIPSMINWSVGKRKLKEYQIRLDDFRAGLFYAPDNSLGVSIAFKF